MLSKLAVVVLIIGLIWGLEQVVVSPLQTGTVYPKYSSLRSDPMGTMVLYESLGKIVATERLYKSRMSQIPGPGTTIFVLGVDPVAWAKIDVDTIKEYEELISKGARLVIAFLPIAKPWADTEEKPVEKRWNIKLNYKEVPGESGDITKESSLVLKGGPGWIRIAGNTLERELGKGAVVLAGDSFPLSNEGLREERDARLIVKLVGPADRVVFDENHFGVVETGSVTKLMRKYHLEGALAILALVAGLFLWRSASSLLPPKTPSVEAAVTGRDSLEGMISLLRRGIPESDLLRVCWDEWKKTALKSKELKSPEFNLKKPLVIYREIAKTLAEKS